MLFPNHRIGNRECFPVTEPVYLADTRAKLSEEVATLSFILMRLQQMLFPHSREGSSNAIKNEKALTNA